MLINNEFVFLPIPRNASTSIYVSIKTWGIPINFGIKETNEKLKNNLIDNYDTMHNHYDYTLLKTIFPNRPFVGIERNSTDRFVSAAYYLINFLYINNFDLKHDYLNFNTDDFISFFTEFFIEYNEFVKIHKLYGNIEGSNSFGKKYFYNDLPFEKSKKYPDYNINELFCNFLCVALSQYYYGLQYCDEIINIKNIKIIEDKIKIFKPNFNLIKVNEKNKFFKLNLEKTDKLEEFVYEYIDKPFLTKNLI